ncbi:MAG: M56 family metallopeptidase [Balneolaceae bacterium]|nr:M56 family metallopeptidase [Balneolaceae bacterium]
MIEVINIIKDLGYASLGAFWFPVLMWTIFVLVIMSAITLVRNVNPLYQYHLRLALVISLPASLLFYGLAGLVNDLVFQQEPVLISLIVIDNPISVSGPAVAESSLSFIGSTGFWIGILNLLLAVGSIGGIGLVYRQVRKLKAFTVSLPEHQCIPVDRLSNINRALLNDLTHEPSLFHSTEVSVPFTYGWLHPVVVIPSDIVTDTNRLNMAVRHELLHIDRHDYPLKTVTELIKMLFWFHPLLHLLDRQITEYREISCDGAVLTDVSISRKAYASLLFELAPRDVHDLQAAVSMAVKSSTLKKRIQQMNLFRYNQTSTIRSIMLSAGVALMAVLFISCSDLTTDGITKSEIETVQQDIATDTDSSQKPLYVINGEILEEQNRTIMARIKHEYIRNIEVLKGQQAINRYGDKGKNGVVIMEVVDREAALSDLKSPEEMQQSAVKKSSDGGDYFVVVEKMPHLKGGLSDLYECIDYPEDAQQAGIEGRVIVQFIVNEQGDVENPKVVRGIGGGADEESLRCVEQAEFEPGMQRGEPVRVQYSLPVVFKLGD